MVCMLQISEHKHRMKAYRYTLHVEDPVEAVRAAGWPAVSRELTVAHHDFVFVLYLWFSVRVDVLPDDLPDLWPSDLLRKEM